MRRASLIITCFTLMSVFHVTLIFLEDASGYTPHAPININGNGEFTAANGVTGGSGKPSNPYIIEGWEINASAEKGILIINTNAHFLIRNVYVHSGVLANPPTSGISLQNAANGHIENCSLSDNRVGIDLSNANNITLRANTFTSNGITIGGFSLADHNTHTITPDNLVNGKPLYYYKDCTNLHIDGETVGQLLIVNCTDVQVTNLEMSDPGASIGISFGENVSVTGNTVTDGFGGIILGFVTRATVSSNTVSNDWMGIGLGYVNNTTVTNNKVTSNRVYGIHFEECYGVLINNNTLTGNNMSLVNERSDNITIEGNTVQDNDLGIGWHGGSSMLVHHNDFINNTVQTYGQVGSGGTWDNGYPSGGNYWSDYTGIDLKSGGDQDQPGSDGIGDTPYLIDTDGQDRYPLMEPVAQPNDPPTASFTLSPTTGDVTETFTANASSSHDSEDPTSALEVRWDWEDDGIWDTGWSTTKEAQNQYDNPGTYTIRLDVRDTGGLTNNTTRQIVVTSEDGTTPQDSELDLYLIAAVIVVVVVVVALLIVARRKRKQPEDEEPPTSQNDQQQST